jgi:hypothetical protein
MWATGAYKNRSGIDRGLLVNVASPGGSKGEVLTSAPMRDLHYRWAVGDRGAEDYIHDIGGPGFADLWFVGQQEVGAGGSSPSIKGWIIQFK